MTGACSANFHTAEVLVTGTIKGRWSGVILQCFGDILQHFHLHTKPYTIKGPKILGKGIPKSIICIQLCTRISVF